MRLLRKKSHRTEPNPVAERIEEPTITPVEGSDKAAESIVTPVAAAEEASLL